MFNLNVNFPAILDRQGLCRTSASRFRTRVLRPHVQEVHLCFGRAGGTVGHEACSKNLLAGAKIDRGKVVQPRNHLVQPTVDIGWRQLIFCYVATKVMQPRYHLAQPSSHVVQPTVDIGWRQLIFCYVATKVMQPSNHVRQPRNHLVQPTVDIGWHQLIVCYVATKVMQPRNHRCNLQTM